jgi:ATP-dependent DNA helicase RecG
MTLADLGRKCVRRNPLIADLLHRIDFIEKAGTGIRRIRDEVRTWGGPAPLFETTGFFTTTIYPIANVRTQMAIISESEVGAQSRAQSRAQSIVDRVDQSARVLVEISVHALSPRELTAALGLGSKSGALKRVLRELLEGELIAMTIPERRTSRLQKYRITQRGVQRLAERTQSK